MSTKQKAMQRAFDHADQQWKQEAYATIVRIAKRQTELTTDDVWEAIPTTVETHEPRALGPIMAAAARNGIIEKTGTWIETKRPNAHQRPVAVWKSKIVSDWRV